MAATFLFAAGKSLPLRAMQWLMVDGDADEYMIAVNYDPGVCLAENASLSAREGELLFRSPALLGGQAAKARLSCASCHVEGGDNPYFHFPSASGDAGTADVSNSFFSAAGANGTFDPVLIPDLSTPGGVSRVAPGALEDFLRTLIVKEFAGDAPGTGRLRALADYIRHLQKCAPAKRGVVRDFTIVERAAEMARSGLGATDAEMVRLHIATARDTLKLIHERFAGSEFGDERDRIEGLSIDLLKITRMADMAKREVAFDQWRARSAVLKIDLRRKEGVSLYSDIHLKPVLESANIGS